MAERINAGWAIVSSVVLTKNIEVVIGYKETNLGSSYVCWFCQNKNDYYWGRYTKNYEDAVKILMNRLKDYYP